MASKNLFGSNKGSRRNSPGIGSTKSKALHRKAVPETNAINEAGGKAYSFKDQHALAQYVATGCLGSTFYAGADEQLDKILELAKKCDAKFVAQCAIYARDKGHMKDTPALLLAILAASEDPKAGVYFEKAFSEVCDNGRMLRNFCQIIRSGKAGRSSFGSKAKRLIQNWLNTSSDRNLFNASVGNDPSLADIIKMVHPHAKDEKRNQLFRYILGKDTVNKKLPENIVAFEKFKKGDVKAVPDVPFLMLTSLSLTKDQWKQVAMNMGWQALRMNLSALNRHGVFDDSKVVNYVAAKLSDAEEVKKARVFPYQLLMAFRMTEGNLPSQITNALQDAMEIAVDNVPVIDGKVVICPDVSGSMSSPVTGYRGGVTSHVSCVEVAALVAASILKKNPTAEVLPFANYIKECRVNSRDSIMTNAKYMASLLGGGTDCYLPLQKLNNEGRKADLVFYISDNMSWGDFTERSGTAGMREWTAFKKNNPAARLVAMDIQPNSTTQFTESDSVLNIGGFSDAVFDVVASFASGKLNAKHWVETIAKIKI